MQSFLVDWWYDRLYFERESRHLAHQERVMSPDIMAMYNRPQSVINLQALYDNVMALQGFPREKASQATTPA